jgi:signal transduction histidine kinase
VANESRSDCDAASISAILSRKRHALSQGLDLDLYIAAEIAQTHGGRLDIASSTDQTRFTLRIPHARMLDTTGRLNLRCVKS